MFRIDAAKTSYLLGVNEQEQVKTLLGPATSRQPPVCGSKSHAWHLLMPPVTTTPGEFVGWGGGLAVEPSLKISFPDSTRDLTLKYLSYEIQDNQLVFQMMDIAREDEF